MSRPISGFLFDREIQDAGFTRHEMSNQRLRDAAYRLLVRGRLYRFDDADEIEYGVSGPFNDDEGRAASPQAAPTQAVQTGVLSHDARDASRYNAFFDAGLPITFCGVDYFDKPSLDAAIDTAIAAAQPASGDDQ